jgi:hypothetical protein
VALAGWTGAVPSALLASRPCVQQLKATENRNVCLPDAADVVPIAEAPMRWHAQSSNSECVMVVGSTMERLGRDDGMARQGKQSSKATAKWGPPSVRFVSEPHLQLLSKSFALHVAHTHGRTHALTQVADHVQLDCDSTLSSSFWDRLTSSSNEGSTACDKETTSHIRKNHFTLNQEKDKFGAPTVCAYSRYLTSATVYETRPSDCYSLQFGL